MIPTLKNLRPDVNYGAVTCLIVRLPLVKMLFVVIHTAQGYDFRFTRCLVPLKSIGFSSGIAINFYIPWNGLMFFQKWNQKQVMLLNRHPWQRNYKLMTS